MTVEPLTPVTLTNCICARPGRPPAPPSVAQAQALADPDVAGVARVVELIEDEHVARADRPEVVLSVIVVEPLV